MHQQQFVDDNTSFLCRLLAVEWTLERFHTIFLHKVDSISHYIINCVHTNVIALKLFQIIYPDVPNQI
jgi:hypothetical protein